MAKMIKCKTCGADIAKSAKVCPNCGANNKKPPVVLFIIFAIIVIIIIAAVAGGNNNTNQPQKVSDAFNSGFQDGLSSENQEPQNLTIPQTTKESEKTVFDVGETVELNNVRATLLSVTSNYGANYMTPTSGNVYVVCEFEIENSTDKDIAVSTMMSFDCYFDDYAANLSIGAITSANETQLDGTIAGGKKMKGVVGYEAPEDWKEMEIHYSPSFWGNKEIVFTATHE